MGVVAALCRCAAAMGSDPFATPTERRGDQLAGAPRSEAAVWLGAGWTTRRQLIGFIEGGAASIPQPIEEAVNAVAPSADSKH